MHFVGFIIRMYHDWRSSERQIPTVIVEKRGQNFEERKTNKMQQLDIYY